MIVIEVLNKQGKVSSRTQHDGFPIQIGRAYDNNQVILDDEYVSSRHVSIDRDEDGCIRVEDLNSENGLFRLPGRQRISHTVIEEEGLFRLGQTMLRIRTSAFVVPPTKHDTEYLVHVLQAFNHGWTAAGIMAITALWMGFEVYWNSFSKADWGELAMFPMLALVLISVWAGSWARTSKINLHQDYFKVHACIACLALLASSLFGVLDEYYAFAVSGGWTSEVLGWGGSSVLLGVLLLAHLRMCTELDAKRLVFQAGVSALGIMGLVAFSSHVGSTQFLSAMSYRGELKPPAFQLAESLTLDEFFSESQHLKKKIDASIREESQEE